MAKTGDAPDRKPKPKPRARGARPAFAQSAAPAAGSAWVYRSDAPAAKSAPPVVAKPVVKVPVVKKMKDVPAAGPSRAVQALDLVTWPIAVSLMAVLAPMRRLLGPSSR